METDLDRASGLTVTLIALSVKELQQLDDVVTPDELVRVDTESAELSKMQRAWWAAGNPKTSQSDEIRIETLRCMDSMLTLLIDHKITDADGLSNKWISNLMTVDQEAYAIFKENGLTALTAIAEATGMDLEPPPPPFGTGKINAKLKP